MSSVSISGSENGSIDCPQAFFWIRPVDDAGTAVSPELARAAYDRAEQLRVYRKRELPDEAVRADLVERAVWSACRAERKQPIRDAGAYVFSAFRRLVDERITRDHRVTNHDAAVLKSVQGRGQSAVTNNLESSILCQQALDSMDPFSRLVWTRQLEGHSIQDIAKEVGVSPDCLSARLRRSAERARRMLSSSDGKSREPICAQTPRNGECAGPRREESPAPPKSDGRLETSTPAAKEQPSGGFRGDNVTLLEPAQVAAWLSVSLSWVRDHAIRKQPRIKAIRVGRLLRFRATDIEDFLQLRST